jgi:GTPase SAR1 family protein
MVEGSFEKLEQKFSSPQEELDYLRGEVAKHERSLLEKGETVPREEIITDKIIDYKGTKPEEILHPDYQLKGKELDSIVLDLSPEEHDTKMEEMVSLLQEKGLLNALSVIEKLKDAHLDDDFHRFLVQYVKAGLSFSDSQEKSPFFRALKMTLYEVALPQSDEKEEKQRNLKELISKMEQFYAGMLSVSAEEDGPDYFTIELANANKSDEFIFYVSVPDTKKSLFEKQILSIFPEAKISEKRDDYNVFNEQGVSVGSYAKQERNHIYPLKTYELFDYDPLNVLLNSFSKISRDGEGAGIQIVFKPVGEKYVNFYKRALKDFSKGMKLKEAIDMNRLSFMGETKKIFKEIAGGLIAKKKDDKDKGSAEQKSLDMDKKILENINNKINAQTVETNIRIIASSETESKALSILSDLESAFNQFENTGSNKLTFERLEGKELRQLFREFSFRVFKEEQKMPLNLKEITTMMHLPENEILGTSQLKQSKAGTAQAPLDLQKIGISLGKNIHRNVETDIYMSPEDRLRHLYVIGQTGTGKTTLLKQMIRQDILNGDGVCMIDPHGSDIQDVLSYVPKERLEDLIYFDPSYTARPMGLNMLEYDIRFPEQKTFVVNEMLSIFNKLFDMKTAGGPMFEQYFRNSVMLVLEDPTSGNTLLDVSRVLSNKAYRDLKISKCKNPLVIQFWKEIAEKAGGEASLANIVPYIVSKFDVFLQNDIMRPIISQEKSAFNFREIMDNKKILLVNLSKGRLGDINANLLGLIIVGKILMAALSRVDLVGKDFAPFYLFIDEFQNITTDSISAIFSEARKYKLSLTVAHQFIAQLEEDIRDSVFGNVGSIASFRVSSEDAEYLEKQFAPVFSVRDLMNIDNLNCYIKMLSSGRPVKPFSLFIPFPPRGDTSYIDKVKELSYLKYGKNRELVEMEIMKKYEKKESPPPVPPTPINPFKI